MISSNFVFFYRARNLSEIFFDGDINYDFRELNKNYLIPNYDINFCQVLYKGRIYGIPPTPNLLKEDEFGQTFSIFNSPSAYVHDVVKVLDTCQTFIFINNKLPMWKATRTMQHEAVHMVCDRLFFQESTKYYYKEWSTHHYIFRRELQKMANYTRKSYDVFITPRKTTHDKGHRGIRPK